MATAGVVAGTRLKAAFIFHCRVQEPSFGHFPIRLLYACSIWDMPARIYTASI